MTQTNFSTSTHYQQITSEERGKIEAFLADGKSQAEIARCLSRSRSTISREIRRGTVRQRKTNYLYTYRYYADTSQLFHEQRRLKCHSKDLINTCWLFFTMLTKALKRHFRRDSVDGFVHAFQQKYPHKPCPSTPTVYRYISQGRLSIRNIDLPAKLKKHVKSNRHSHARTNKRLAGTSIDQRPEVVNKRQRFGDWEGDLVKGKRHASEPALMTLTERLTRYELIVKIPNYHAATCLECLQKVINTRPALFKTITFDNGSEFKFLDQIKGSQIYFAHPYTPSERGSNENQNGLIREYIPKGRSLHNYSTGTVNQVQIALNQKHRRLLGYNTANTQFQAALIP